MIHHLRDNMMAYLKVILFGSIGAFAGGLVWYLSVVITKWEIGIFALLVGFATGWMATLGGGRNFPRAVSFISVMLTLVSLFFSEYFIIHHYAVLRFPEAMVPLFIPLGRMVLLVAEVIIRVTPLTLIFWLIAVYEAYIIPKRILRSTIQKHRQMNT